MKLLNLENCQHVAGGDNAVSVTANIPTENTGAFVNLLGLLLTEQLTATTLAAYLDNDATSFNDMPIEKISFGKFEITRV